MQNTSHAVMAQRIEPLDSLDDFLTPSVGRSRRTGCEPALTIDSTHSFLRGGYQRKQIAGNSRPGLCKIEGGDTHDVALNIVANVEALARCRVEEHPLGGHKP